MAKEKVENTPESDKSDKPSRKRPPPRPNDNKAKVQEAKDLKTLIDSLNRQNAPETSKDITAFAKDTLKLVAKAQKGESAAFRREATKTLVEFRKFVEGTEKLNDQRRTKILSDIDNVALDAKNATYMLLSVAKHQAQNIKLAAHKEAVAQKIKAKEFEKQIVTEATQKAKALEEEARERSKTFNAEREAKFKAMAQDRKAKLKIERQNLTERSNKLKQAKADHSLKMEKERDEFRVQKAQHRNHFKNLSEQLKQNHDARKTALETERNKHRAEHAQAQIELRDLRAQSAAKIKKLKSDLRDDYTTKMRKGRADLAQKRADAMVKNKERIQKLRDMTTEHKIKLKKIEQEASQEALLKKRAFNKKLAEEERAQANKSKHRSELAGKVKSGIYEANPLLHAAVEIGVGLGLHDAAKNYLKKRKDKKEATKLNKLGAVNKAGGAVKAAPAGAIPTPGGAGAPSPGSGSPGGMFSGLLGMLPSISGIISGITSLFGGIAGAFTRLAPLLLNGARFIPGIALVAGIIGGIWKFIEGFNDATSLFGEKIADDDYVRRIYSGFTNVVGSILGLFDTVAGWLGFDTDLAGSFKANAVKVFNSILDTFKAVASGLGNILEYIPGMGGVAKSLKDYGNSASANTGGATGSWAPSNATPASNLNSKTASVASLKDEIESKRTKTASVQVVADNSVRQTSTTFVQSKLDTRNPDRAIDLYTR